MKLVFIYYKIKITRDNEYTECLAIFLFKVIVFITAIVREEKYTLPKENNKKIRSDAEHSVHYMPKIVIDLHVPFCETISNLTIENMWHVNVKNMRNIL